MKITDYGLWYKEVKGGCWSKSFHGFAIIYLNGRYIGSSNSSWRGIHIYAEYLEKINIKLKKGLPVEVQAGGFRVWEFPLGYIPTDSDFEVLDEAV